MLQLRIHLIFSPYVDSLCIAAEKKLLTYFAWWFQVVFCNQQAGSSPIFPTAKVDLKVFIT